MNISDSERIAGFLENNGYELASDIKDADLVIFNTCGVRQAAENRVYSQVHNLRTKNYKPQTKIILTGCLANRKDVQRRLKNKVDLFCEIKNFPEAFQKLIEKPSVKTLDVQRAMKVRDIQCLSIDDNSLGHLMSKYDRDYLNIIPKYQNNFQAYVPIMTGCNNFCAYCVVPYARGRETSRPATEIISEIKSLVNQGYKSITLLGQNVNSYKDTSKSPSPEGEGARRADEAQKVVEPNPFSSKEKVPDKADEVTFPQLLKKINAIQGKFWINFVSSHPKDMSDGLIETIAKSKKVCENIHLPIQSGSDEIIQKMNRKYTAKHYLSLVRKIKLAFKKYKPDVQYALTSDIIVGFPSETKKQFLQSAEIMKKCKYDMVFFGQYSPRPGTVAWKMKDNVSKPEKERREQFLNEILKKTAFANNKKYNDTIQEVLIETQKNGNYFGKTRTGKNVKIISNKKNLVGQFAKIKIIKINTWNLEGEIK